MFALNKYNPRLGYPIVLLHSCRFHLYQLIALRGPYAFGSSISDRLSAAAIFRRTLTCLRRQSGVIHLYGYLGGNSAYGSIGSRLYHNGVEPIHSVIQPRPNANVVARETPRGTHGE